jgi:hypothetical protein
MGSAYAGQAAREAAARPPRAESHRPNAMRPCVALAPRPLRGRRTT